jgi:predicted unusual protein kinase regulating ubiquinone biosynthesis (AarF/ABC1/UbiB family)
LNQTDPKLARCYSRLRKQEVREAFAALDARKRPGLSASSFADSLGDLDDLIAVLSQLGPVFSQLGRYLGSRPDCIRLEHCLRLRRTGGVTMLSPEALQPYFSDFFPASMPPWLLNLREDPRRSDHLIHVYRWSPQPEISFRLVNPNFAEAWQIDRLFLPLVEQPARNLWRAVPLGRIIRQFELCVQRAFDLDREMQCLNDFDSFELLPSPVHPGFVLPKIADEFCCHGMLAIREPPLAAVGSQPLHESESVDTAGESYEATPALLEFTRNLCLTWLHHALKLSCFPEAPTAANVALTATRRIACLGGPVASLDREFQDALAQYLGAVASNRPDEAASTLLSIFSPGKKAADFETVRDRFRQVVPFRDGGWGRIGQQETLAECIFVQWRIATESGYEAPEELIAFLRSFWEIAVISKDVTVQHDVLRDALDEFRWIDAFDNLRELFAPATLAHHGQDWINLMMEMPERLNARSKNQKPSPAASTPTQKPESLSSPLWIVASAHAFVLAAIGTLLVKLAEAQVGNQSLFLAGFGAFTMVGLSLLHSIRRTK